MTPEQRERALLALGRLHGMALGCLWQCNHPDSQSIEEEMDGQVQAIMEALGCDE